MVTTAKDTTDGMKLAIKRIRPYANDEWDARHTLREIRLLKLLGPHPNVITLYDLSLFEEKSELYMMMEVMDCDLHHIIQSKQSLSEMHHKCFAKQMLEGIKAMHSIGVFHRDLKPGNLLVSKDCKLRITDFGLARYMDETTLAGNNAQNPMTEYVVTRWYRCPELLLAPNRPYSEAIDLWSIGCIMAELIKRKPLFPGKSHANQVQLIFEVVGFANVSELGFSVSSEALTFLNRKCRFPKQNLADVIPQASPEAIHFINSLLCVNPRRRPTAQQALTYAYVKDAETFNDYSIRYLRPPPPGYFDFETAEHSLEQLRTLIHEEVGFAGRIGHLGPQNAAHGGFDAAHALTLGSMRMTARSGKSGRLVGAAGLDSQAPTQVKGYQANQANIFRGDSNKSMINDDNHSYRARKASLAETAMPTERDGHIKHEAVGGSRRPSFMNGSAGDASVSAAANGMSQMNLNGNTSSNATTQRGHADDMDESERHELTGSRKKITPRKLEAIAAKPVSRSGSRKGFADEVGGAIAAPSTTGKIESERVQVPHHLKPLSRHGTNPQMVANNGGGGVSSKAVADGGVGNEESSGTLTKKKTYGLLPVAFGFQKDKDSNKDTASQENNDSGSRKGFPTISRFGSSLMNFRGSSNGRKGEQSTSSDAPGGGISSQNSGSFRVGKDVDNAVSRTSNGLARGSGHGIEQDQKADKDSAEAMSASEKSSILTKRGSSYYDEAMLPALRKA